MIIFILMCAVLLWQAFTYRKTIRKQIVRHSAYRTNTMQSRQQIPTVTVVSKTGTHSEVYLKQNTHTPSGGMARLG